MLNRDQINLLREGWKTNILTQYKDKFKTFFIKLKHQFQYNATAKAILGNYITTGTLSKSDATELKTMSTDLLKMVGLSSIVALPGGMLLMIFLINSAKHLGIDLIPSHFESKNADIEYGIKVQLEDEDGDRTSMVVYNKNSSQPYLISKLVFEKIWNGLDMLGITDEELYKEIFPSDEFVKIEHIKTESNYEQKGFGTILMLAAIEEIKKTGFDRIYLNASPMGKRIPLDDLISFYESLGFKVFNKTVNNAEMYMAI